MIIAMELVLGKTCELISGGINRCDDHDGKMKRGT
jgi:hypothetical protein